MAERHGKTSTPVLPPSDEGRGEEEREYEEAEVGANGHGQPEEQPQPHLLRASDFKEAEYLTLTSRRGDVKVSRGSLISMVYSGRIDNPLLRAAYRIAGEMKAQNPPDGTAEEEGEAPPTPEELEQLRREHYEALDSLCCAVVTSPPFCMKREDETEATVWVGRLTEQDKALIAIYAQMPLVQLERFRVQQRRDNLGLPE